MRSTRTASLRDQQQRHDPLQPPLCGISLCLQQRGAAQPRTRILARLRGKRWRQSSDSVRIHGGNDRRRPHLADRVATQPRRPARGPRRRRTVDRRRILGEVRQRAARRKSRPRYFGDAQPHLCVQQSRAKERDVPLSIGATAAPSTAAPSTTSSSGARPKPAGHARPDSRASSPRRRRLPFRRRERPAGSPAPASRGSWAPCPRRPFRWSPRCADSRRYGAKASAVTQKFQFCGTVVE